MKRKQIASETLAVFLSLLFSLPTAGHPELVEGYALRPAGLEENAAQEDFLKSVGQSSSSAVTVRSKQWLETEQKIAGALRHHPGGSLTGLELARLAAVTPVTLYRHPYRNLVAQENVRRQNEEPGKPPVVLIEKGRIRERLREVLRNHPGGPLTVDALAASMEARVSTIYFLLKTSGLLAEENARRAVEEPLLPPLQLIGSQAADVVSRIVTALQGHPGGPLSSERLAALAGVDLVTLKTYHASALVLQENARRKDLVPPGEAVLFIDQTPTDPIRLLKPRSQMVLAKRYDRWAAGRDYLIAWLALVRVLQRLPYTGELYWVLTRLLRPGTEERTGYAVFTVQRIGISERLKRRGLLGWLEVIPHPYRRMDPEPQVQEQLPEAVSQARQDLERLPRALSRRKPPPVPWHARLDQLDSQTQRDWLKIVRALTPRQLDVLVYCLACQERYGSWPTEAESAQALGFTRERGRQLYNALWQIFSPLEPRARALIPAPRMRQRSRALVLDNVEQVRQEIIRRVELLGPDQAAESEPADGLEPEADGGQPSAPSSRVCAITRAGR